MSYEHTAYARAALVYGWQWHNDTRFARIIEQFNFQRVYISLV